MEIPCSATHLLILVSPIVPSFNNHYYTILSGISNATGAAAQASSLTFKNMTGYLATLDSYEEYAFILYQLRAHRALISANDTKSEGVWVTGPTPSSIGGAATVLPWAQGEPGGGTSKNCAIITYYGLVGTYCALFDTSGLYVIEYECASPKVLANGACISKF
jgi:hypothetical protein